MQQDNGSKHSLRLYQNYLKMKEKAQTHGLATTFT